MNSDLFGLLIIGAGVLLGFHMVRNQPNPVPTAPEVPVGNAGMTFVDVIEKQMGAQ